MNRFPAILLLLGLLCCGDKHGPGNSQTGNDDPDVQLEKFEARKRYSSFTRETLASIPDAEIEQAIVDYVYEHVLGGDDEANHAAFKKLSPGFRAVYATIMLEELVAGGGFAQFFSEPESRYVEDAVEGFSLLGASSSSRITRRAMLIVRGNGKSGSAMEMLSELDSGFYNTGEQTGSLRIRYIRNNPSMFITTD